MADNRYSEPASEVARAIQYPMHDAGWPDRVVNAYFKDCEKARRRAALNEKEGKG